MYVVVGMVYGKKEGYMNEQHPHIELCIDVGSDEENSALEKLLAILDVELLVKSTLQAAGIVQPVTLSLLITGDEAIQELNRQYRHQDKPTDVLSFPLLDKPLVNAPPDQLWMPAEEQHEGENQAKKEDIPPFVTPQELLLNLGDIVISWPTVVRQAGEAGHSASYELLYLIAHGVLHLVGYDDQSEAGYQAMVQIQQHVLQAMGQLA